MVNLLIAGGADVDHSITTTTPADKEYTTTALSLAVHRGSQQLVDILLRAGATGDDTVLRVVGGKEGVILAGTSPFSGEPIDQICIEWQERKPRNEDGLIWVADYVERNKSNLLKILRADIKHGCRIDLVRCSTGMM